MWRRSSMIVLALLLLSLACNFPGFPGAPAPGAPSAIEQPEGEDDGGLDADATSEARPTPAPLETATPEGFVAPATQTPTPTPTPTVTPTPTATATPGEVEPGPPLTFEEPAWALATWQQVEGTSDWEGEIDIHVTGGAPPYRAQLENNDAVDGLTVTARWRLCTAMPATVRVWSADGQQIQRQIWVGEVGCSDE